MATKNVYSQGETVPVLKDCFIAVLPSIRSNAKAIDVLYLPGMPEISNDSTGSSWDKKSVVGTTQPVVSWSHTEPTSLSMSITFVAFDSFERDVLEKVNWCRALCYPNDSENPEWKNTGNPREFDKYKKELSNYNNDSPYTKMGSLIVSISWQPATVKIVIGNFINFRGICDSFAVRWNTDTVDLDTKIPSSAVVDLSFTQLHIGKYLSRYSVKRGNMLGF